MRCPHCGNLIKESKKAVLGAKHGWTNASAQKASKKVGKAYKTGTEKSSAGTKARSKYTKKAQAKQKAASNIGSAGLAGNKTMKKGYKAGFIARGGNWKKNG